MRKYTTTGMNPPKPVLSFLIAVIAMCSACGDRGPVGEENPFDAMDVSLPPLSDTVSHDEGFYDNYEHTDRLIWQKPDMVIDLLGAVKNKTIADIGAGAGFFSLRLSTKAKKVIAIDIDPRYVRYLDSIKQLEVPTRFQDRLETRLGLENDPKLKPNEADIVMIVNTYMYLEDRVRYMNNLREVLPEDGKVLIIDFKKKRTSIGPPQAIRLPLFEAEEELYEAGFRKVSTNDTSLDYQYIILAEK